MDAVIAMRFTMTLACIAVARALALDITALSGRSGTACWMSLRSRALRSLFLFADGLPSRFELPQKTLNLGRHPDHNILHFLSGALRQSCLHVFLIEIPPKPATPFMVFLARSLNFTSVVSFSTPKAKNRHLDEKLRTPLSVANVLCTCAGHSPALCFSKCLATIRELSSCDPMLCAHCISREVVQKCCRGLSCFAAEFYHTSVSEASQTLSTFTNGLAH